LVQITHPLCGKNRLQHDSFNALQVFFYQQPESVPVPGEQSKAGGSSSQAADAQGTTPVPGVAQQPAEKQKV